MNRPSRLAAASLALGGAMLFAAAPVLAEESLATSRSFSQDADALLRQVSEARRAIAAHDDAGAGRALARAQAAQERAVALASRTGRYPSVPIYGELVTGSVIDATASSRSTGGADYSVRRSVSQATDITLDFVKVGRRLASAKQALASGNDQAASDTLGALGDDLTVETVVRDAPLATARQNIAIAHDALAAHRDGEAKTALAAASAALDRYAATPGEHASEARDLSRRLTRLQGMVARDRKGSENALARGWSSVVGWFKAHA